ncbi:unnamed protein product [Prorocentrum cordatum]|uniref:Uncharacterized protein n=1 Tax=Prorocentrum cordatum TaxID=2364126 RepID=A0ABN9SCM9_9DINO|nr:unnamed protein product [Polarella glacialis]
MQLFLLRAVCFDWQPAPQEAWSDGDGNSCRYYERELLVRGTCSESANDGMTAIQACCVCGGGVSRTDAVTSPNLRRLDTFEARGPGTFRRGSATRQPECCCRATRPERQFMV